MFFFFFCLNADLKPKGITPWPLTVLDSDWLLLCIWLSDRLTKYCPHRYVYAVMNIYRN